MINVGSNINKQWYHCREWQSSKILPPDSGYGGSSPIHDHTDSDNKDYHYQPHLTLKRKMKIPPAQWRLMKLIHRMWPWMSPWKIWIKVHLNEQNTITGEWHGCHSKKLKNRWKDGRTRRFKNEKRKKIEEEKITCQHLRANLCTNVILKFNLEQVF